MSWDNYGLDAGEVERTAGSAVGGAGTSGSQWLLSVASDFFGELEDWKELSEESVLDRISSMADSCVPIYTKEIWDIFVSLQAWDADVDDYLISESMQGDMTKGAQLTLYMVAEAGLHNLWESYRDLEIEGEEEPEPLERDDDWPWMVKNLWEQINALAEVEDFDGIDEVVTESGVKPLIHVGKGDELENDPTMMAEYVLGQWAAILEDSEDDSGIDLIVFNTARNLSLRFYQQTHGEAA